MLAWLKILCAVDFSDSSRHAVDLAADLAKRVEAELTLVHVHHETPVDASLPADTYERIAGQAEEMLAGWRAEAEQRAGRAVRMVLARGDPVVEVLRIADGGNYDLLVAGTHGRTGIKRALMGSVAETIVRRAPCPVLVARPAPTWGD